MSNEETRRRYDNNETVDTIENEAVAFIISAFESILSDIDEKVFYAKLIDNMKDLIKREIGACKNHIRKASKQIPLLLKLRKKIKYKGCKSNILIIRLERELNSVKAIIRDKNRRIEVMKFALTIVEDYEFEADKRPAVEDITQSVFNSFIKSNNRIW